MPTTIAYGERQLLLGAIAERCQLCAGTFGNLNHMDKAAVCVEEHIAVKQPRSTVAVVIITFSFFRVISNLQL